MTPIDEYDVKASMEIKNLADEPDSINRLGGNFPDT